MKQPDFTYIPDGGLFFSVYPENEAAENTVRQMIIEHGTNKLFWTDFREFRRQARQSGYSVRKAHLPRISDDELLAELQA